MFLKANKDNGIIAEVIGGRKRENGLVVPCLYKCQSKNKIIAEILINSSEKYQQWILIILKKNILERKKCFYLKKTKTFSCRVGALIREGALIRRNNF